MFSKIKEPNIKSYFVYTDTNTYNYDLMKLKSFKM